jgi:8-oxo-dGTP pyrophosphatase MutT (NUDIX family)
MQLNSEVITTPPRASATVVLLRDTPQKGLEVFLLRRHKDSAVLGGAYVFPGGKLDEADSSEHVLRHLDRETHHLHTSLAEPEIQADMAAGLYVAAIREALEECGVLFARARNSDALAHDTVQRAQWQKRLHAGETFADVLASGDLQLDTQNLAPWSRWITPRMPSVTSKRFDTRFFVAVLPPSQTPIHDDVEAIDSIWLSPRDALLKYWDRGISMAPPQIMTLVNLLPYGDCASVLRAALARKPSAVMPETFDADGLRHICYPGDPQHSIKEKAMLGPTRLRFIEGRFEPKDGVGAFLDPEGI